MAATTSSTLSRCVRDQAVNTSKLFCHVTLDAVSIILNPAIVEARAQLTPVRDAVVYRVRGRIMIAVPGSPPSGLIFDLGSRNYLRDVHRILD